MTSQTSNSKILLLAGEVSGDAHAARLVEQIKRINPHIEFYGIGGDALAGQGMELLYHISQMAFLGIAEVIRHLPFIRRVHNSLLLWAGSNRPVCALLVDYPGFNLKMAKSLKKLSIPVIYYISPQLWAWGKKRVKKVKKYVDKMMVLFPFEKTFYEQFGIEAEYVGHPLADTHSGSIPEQVKSINPHKIKVGLLPGSRYQEVASLLPKMVETAGQLFRQGLIHEIEVVRVKHVADELFLTAIGDNHQIALVEKPLKDVLPEYDAVIVASGTATLECGLYRVPMVIVYHVSPLTYFLGKLLIKLKNIGLVNIVAEKEVAVELIQSEFSVANAVREIKLLLEPEANKKRREDLKIISEKLGEAGASQRAARVVLDFLNVRTH